jgi:hypothetical protein
MDVVKYFKGLTRMWDNESRCGFCWVFGAPLTEGQANIQKVEEEDAENCCVRVMVRDVRVRRQNAYGDSGFLSEVVQDHFLVLDVVVPSKMGVNNFNEIPGHPVDESKWETIIYPLLECVTEESIMDLCKLLKTYIQVPTWDASMKLNWLDNNYCGWSISMTLRDDGSKVAVKNVIQVEVIGIADWSGDLFFQEPGLAGQVITVAVENGKGLLINDLGADTYDISIESGFNITDPNPSDGVSVPDTGITITIEAGGGE